MTLSLVLFIPIQPFPIRALHEFTQYPHQRRSTSRHNNFITAVAGPSVGSLSTGMTCVKAVDLQLFRNPLAFWPLRILSQASKFLPSCRRLSLTRTANPRRPVSERRCVDSFHAMPCNSHINYYSSPGMQRAFFLFAWMYEIFETEEHKRPTKSVGYALFII